MSSVPDDDDGDGPSLFLAGGITGCPDWQRQLRDKLADTPLTLLNPRRANFPIDDPRAAPLLVGAHPDYARRDDVVTQTRLARPDVTVMDSLDALAELVRARWNCDLPAR